MPIFAPQIHAQQTNETRNHAVSFIGMLDSGELLTGTPTVVEVTTTALTLGSKAVNTATLTINGVSNVAGQAVQYSCTTATAGAYVIRITCATNATPAQTVSASVRLNVVSP